MGLHRNKIRLAIRRDIGEKMDAAAVTGIEIFNEPPAILTVSPNAYQRGTRRRRTRSYCFRANLYPEADQLWEAFQTFDA
jgi:hypothetical protein